MNLQEYWDNKHPKKMIKHAGRAIPTVCPTCKQQAVRGKILVDIRTLITPNDICLQEIIEKNNLKKESDDETMLEIQKFVCNNLRYVGDGNNQGVPEYWQFPFETLHLKIGDCEDGAILIASLAIACGIPEYKIRVTAGWVQEYETAPQGGHAYVAYLRKKQGEKDEESKESKGDWVCIDWCYFQDPQTKIEKKPILKENKRYKDIWFSFNNKFAWAHKEFEIEGRIKNLDPDK